MLRPEALHGEPPYTAVLTGHTSNAANCTALQLDMGDGHSETLACPTEEYGEFAVRHTYETAATYYAQATMQLTNGTTISSPTQTIVVAVPQLVAANARLLWWSVWLLTVGLAVAVAWWCVRRRAGRWRWWGLAGVGLLLMTAVPPFSYLPDPLGLWWNWRGGYVEDVRLPFANRFVLGEATAELRPYLDGLIGQTGLDPLHPTEPLVGYSFGRVTLDHKHRTDVAVIFHYADGSQRQYPIPLSHPESFLGLFYRHDWHYDGLARLRAQHLQVGGIPLVDTPLSTPQRLHAMQADWATRYGQFGYLEPAQMQWSPDGESFFWLSPGDRSLWQGSSAERPLQAADEVDMATWAANGTLVFTRLTREQSPGTIIYRATDSDGSEVWLIVPSWIRPYASQTGLWYVADEQLWFAAYGAEAAEAVRPLPQAAPGTPLQLSPDEQWVAYSCRTAESGLNDLCLLGPTGVQAFDLDAAPMAFAWRPDGRQLAVGYQPYSQFGPLHMPAWLDVITLNEADEARLTQHIQVAPQGNIGSIAWLPDGELLVQTYPYNGRRIIRVDLTTAAVTDLSQPRWDAIFALHPDGRTLLLNNGRGGFWQSQLLEETAVQAMSRPNQGIATFSINKSQVVVQWSHADEETVLGLLANHLVHISANDPAQIVDIENYLTAQTK